MRVCRRTLGVESREGVLELERDGGGKKGVGDWLPVPGCLLEEARWVWEAYERERREGEAL